MDETKTIVILGGGVGGVVAAKALRKELAEPHRVILVDRERDHLFAPSLLWLMIGQRTARQISRPLARLAKKGIEVVCGDISRIDPDTRRVHVIEHSPAGDMTERTLEADYLIVALGADLDTAAVPGLSEAGHSFYSLEGAESLRAALEGFTCGRIVVLTATPAYKCPAAPYEAAMLIDHHARKRHIRDSTQIDIYAAEPGPLGVAGPEVSAGVRGMVEAKDIGYHPDHQLVGVDPDARVLTFADQTTEGFDLLAYVPPHRAPQVIRDAGMTDESGWISVDRNTLETSHPGVFAIGDVVSIPLKMGKPLPKAGVFAEREAKVVAHNITQGITGDSNPTSFDGHGGCFIETGAGKAGFGRGDFYAEPKPQIKLHNLGRRWHLSKVLFEKNWLYREL